MNFVTVPNQVVAHLNFIPVPNEASNHVNFFTSHYPAAEHVDDQNERGRAPPFMDSDGISQTEATRAGRSVIDWVKPTGNSFADWGHYEKCTTGLEQVC